MRICIVAILAFQALTATSLGAQQSQAEVHANYVYATRSHTNAWGAGANYQLTWGGQSAPVKLGTSLGPDYTKQENGGPGQTSVSFDATLQPGGDGSLTPYAGGSVSENWSIGNNKLWSGARVGLETLAGVQVKLGSASKFSGKAEERYGYVKGQEHTLTSRLGIAVSF